MASQKEKALLKRELSARGLAERNLSRGTSRCLTEAIFGETKDLSKRELQR